MKILTRTAVVNSQQNFRFKFNRNVKATEDSKSLQAWEEENPEYATWNLISDESEPKSC